MQMDVIQIKRSPRILLALDDDNLTPLPGVTLQWPNRSESAVFDLNFAGLAVSTDVVSLAGTTRIEKIKMGHAFDLALKIAGLEDPLPVKLKVVKLTAKIIGFAFDTISATGRLAIEQTMKDALICLNLRPDSTLRLHPHLKADSWWHGPFDTNIFIWRSADDSLKKMVVEYDNLVWIFDQGEISIVRSMSAVSEAQGYLPNHFETSLQKMAMGNGWKARLVRVLEEAPELESKNEILALLKA